MLVEGIAKSVRIHVAHNYLDRLNREIFYCVLARHTSRTRLPPRLGQFDGAFRKELDRVGFVTFQSNLNLRATLSGSALCIKRIKNRCD
jgi:hypothetical protein